MCALKNLSSRQSRMNLLGKHCLPQSMSLPTSSSCTLGGLASGYSSQAEQIMQLDHEQCLTRAVEGSLELLLLRITAIANSDPMHSSCSLVLYHEHAATSLLHAIKCSNGSKDQLTHDHPATIKCSCQHVQHQSYSCLRECDQVICQGCSALTNPSYHQPSACWCTACVSSLLRDKSISCHECATSGSLPQMSAQWHANSHTIIWRLKNGCKVSDF